MGKFNNFWGNGYNPIKIRIVNGRKFENG